MTRKTQLWALIICSAITAALQYAIQGTMATGGDPLQFSELFWFIDRALWGVRALIESWVVIYLFTTTVTASNPWSKALQEIMLIVLEVALLALIAFTLGPVFQALGAQETVYDLMGTGGYANWSFAIGAYTSLMMAGAGIGYKIQPFDIVKEERTAVLEEAPRAKREQQPGASNGAREEALPIVLEAIQSNDEGEINQAELAKQLGKSRQTMGNWLKFWQREMVISKLPGRSRFQVIEGGMKIPDFGEQDA